MVIRRNKKKRRWRKGEITKARERVHWTLHFTWFGNQRIDFEERYLSIDPDSNYIFNVNTRNNRTRCEICLKIPIKTPEWRHVYCPSVSIVNFEHVNADWGGVIFYNEQFL